MKAMLAWLEDRTGAGRLARDFFFANIPGGRAGVTSGAAR